MLKKFFSSCPAGVKIPIFLFMITVFGVVGYFLLNKFIFSKPSAFLGSTYAVELPKSIKKEDLNNLTVQQQKELDEKINTILSAKITSTSSVEKPDTPVVIVLTQNGKPILPDLEQKSAEENVGEQNVPTGSDKSRSGQASPTPEPCTDNDPTQDIYYKGVCQDVEKKIEDACTSDQISIDQYYCDKWGTQLCTLQRTVCTYNCRNGRCLTPYDEPISTATPIPTKKPISTPIILPSATPTPTNYPCIDSDGGKKLFTKGVTTWWNTTYEDSCYSVYTGKLVDSCSDFFCRLLEGYCEDGLPVWEAFRCENGCQDSVCLNQPLTPTPTNPPPPTPTGYQSCFDSDGEDKYIRGYVRPASGHSDDKVIWDSCQNWTNLIEAVCDSDGKKSKTISIYCPAGCLDDVCRNSGDLSFRYIGDIKEKYQAETGRDLSADVGQIYRKINEVYGHAYAQISVSMKIGDDNYYNASTNEIVLQSHSIGNQSLITWLIMAAVHDDLSFYMPFNWEIGMRDLLSKDIYIKLFEPEKDGNLRIKCPFYELTGQNPAWATVNGNMESLSYPANPGPSALAATALYKLYINDDQFFVRFNNVLYSQTIDENLKDKIPNIAKSVKPIAEGIFFDDWFANQFILHTKHIPGNYLVPFIDKLNNSGNVKLWVQLTKVLENGSRLDPNGVGVNIKVYDSDNLLLTERQFNSKASGGVEFGELPQAVFPGSSGMARFEITASGYNPISFCYPYQNGQPVEAGQDTHLGVFGCVINRSSGLVSLDTGTNKDSQLASGMFSFPDSYSFRGSANLSYYEDGSKNSSPLTKHINKDVGDYYVSYRLVSAASQTRGGQQPPSVTITDDCTRDWQEYKSDKFGFSFKIPTGWTDTSIDEWSSDNLTYRSLVSTTRPEEQIDPKYKISRFEILASTYDLKTDENYGMWFENNTGNQVKDTVEFKGLTNVEKYIDETEMACSSQTDENSTSCKHRSEMYYFKKNDIYYLLSSSIFITDDLKDKNEQTEKCFLNSFSLINAEQSLTKCTSDVYNSSMNCDNQPKNTVCGNTRLVFDNGKERLDIQEFSNVCSYCSQCDPETGIGGLRGTTFYCLGYYEDDCN